MALDLSSLKKAVVSLDKAVDLAKKTIHGPVDTVLEEVIRAGVIQNFEFTYELSWRFMKRWLEINLGDPTIDGLPRKELFRIAAESQLISDVEAWFVFNRARNKTSHIYNEKIAIEVYEIVIPFLNNAKELLQNLEKKND